MAEQVHSDKAGLEPGWEVSPWVGISRVHGQAMAVPELETSTPATQLQ